MGEPLKFKEYRNRTVTVQYSDRDFGDFSSTKILTLQLATYNARILRYSWLFISITVINYNPCTRLFSLRAATP